MSINLVILSKQAFGENTVTDRKVLRKFEKCRLFPRKMNYEKDPKQVCKKHWWNLIQQFLRGNLLLELKLTLQKYCENFLKYAR